MGNEHLSWTVQSSSERRRMEKCPADHDPLVWGSAVDCPWCHGSNRVPVDENDVDLEAVGRPPELPRDHPAASHASWIPGLSM